MRFFPLAIAAFLLLVPTSSAAQADKPPFAKDPPEVVEFLEEAAKRIDGASIYECIDKITTSPYAYRLMGSPNRDLFVQQHAKVFSSIDARILDQVVTFRRGDLPAGVASASPTGMNIIGVLPGRDLNKWVVVGGHYDTQAPTMGAIDNTSGICVVKEIAKAAIALDLRPQATLVFAWWDGEEWGFYGSTSFVKDHSKTAELLGVAADDVEILVGQSFDIVGVNYPAYNTWAGYGEPTKLLDEFAILNLRQAPTDPEAPMLRSYSERLEKEDKDLLLLRNSQYEGLVKEVNHRLLQRPPQWVNVHQDAYGRSDHVPFIAAGIPGTRIQGSHDYEEWPHYHLPSDTLASASVMAGGQDRLIAGFDAAAEAGGLVALYVAKTGGYGDYGNASQAAQTPAETGAPAQAPADTSSLTLVAAAMALCVGLVLRRRA